MTITSSLADALDTSGATAQDNPGTQDQSSLALAQPELDASTLPPNSTTPTGGNLQTSLSPQDNAAQNMPQSATPPPPPGLKGLGGRLRGVLYGLATGGAAGAVAGSIDPNQAKTNYQDRQQVQAANVHFATARAAEMVAMANRADAAYQNYDSDHQLEVQKQQLGILDEAQKAGFVVRAVTPLDQGTAANTQAAMNNLQQITSTDGAVGEMLHLHVGDKTMSLQLRDPNAGLDLVNSRLTAQGLPKIAQETWTNYSQDARNSLGIDALNFTDPGRGHVTPDTLTTLQNRLGLVKAQSDFTGKDALVSGLQTAVDLQLSILNRQSARQAQQKAEEITTTGAATTANQVSNINATAGPEAAAAGRKAEAVAKGQAQGAMAATGGAKDASGNWNPASVPVSLVEGTMDPTQMSKRGKDYNQQIQLANQYSIEKYGKPFDMAGAQSDYTYSKNPQTQNTLKMIQGMTEQGGAIDIASQAAASLPQIDSATLNKVFNAGATEFGSTQATNFHTAMLGLADEYSKVMGGGVGSDTSRQQALDILKASYSKGQLAGAIGIMRQDIAARQKALVGSNRYLQRQYALPAQTSMTGMGVSLAAARQLQINQGKTDDQIRADITARGHQVLP
jgi:hypothetical protein